MEHIDLRYLCTTIGNLSGIPVRIFEGKTRVFYHSIVSLPKDPLALCQEEVLSITEHVATMLRRNFTTTV